MLELKLLKQKRTYKDSKGEEKSVWDFFIKCGDKLVPIDARYFKGKNGEKDTKYAGRRDVLYSFAEVLPSKEEKETN